MNISYHFVDVSIVFVVVSSLLWSSSADIMR